MITPPIADTLNALIETSKDGEYGFTTCADQARDAALQRLFEVRAIECRQAAGELQDMLRREGGTPDDAGTVVGALHRGWVALLGSVPGDSDLRMLEEAVRGEASALAHYRRAVQREDLPLHVRPVLERQLDGVQRNLDQLEALRDRLKARP